MISSFIITIAIKIIIIWNNKNQITDFKLMDCIYDVYINEYLVGNYPDPRWAS
jgi:hypothetical protein